MTLQTPEKSLAETLGPDTVELIDTLFARLQATDGIWRLELRAKGGKFECGNLHHGPMGRSDFARFDDVTV